MHTFNNMVWVLIIVLILVVCIGWVLLAPIIIEIDTRTPRAMLQVKTIGHFLVWYEGTWKFRFRVLFFSKQLGLESFKRRPSEKKTIRKKKKRNGPLMMKKMYRVLRSFRVEQWQLALQGDDVIRTAWLYPLNFVPRFRGHLQINFTGQNYYYIRIRNQAWRILYAYLRK